MRAIVVVLPELGGGLCTGVVIAPGFVITAAHCFDRDHDGALDWFVEESVPEATIVLGEPDQASAQSGPAGRTSLHPELDVAVVRADWLSETAQPPRPISPNSTPLEPSWVSSPVEIAGYGAAAERGPGTLNFAIEEIVRIEPTHVVVHGRGRTGACEGDSGGPAFARMNDGAIGLLGILDDGDPSCTGEDRYTRMDRLLDWQPFQDAVASTESGAVVCSGLQETGTCLRGWAFWCVEAEIATEDCQDLDRACGWDAVAPGFRCVRPEDDTCAGLGSFAHCAGSNVVSCIDGYPREVACDACSGHCVSWLDRGGAGCEL